MPLPLTKPGELPGVEYLAVRPFTMNGVYYSHDQLVPLDGVEPRRARLMFEARMIRVKPENWAPPAAPDPATVGGPAGGPTVPASSVHAGFGKWYIWRGDEQVAGPLTKAEAAKYLEEHYGTGGGDGKR